MMTDGVWVLVNSELNYYTWIENRPNKSFKFMSPLKIGHFECFYLRKKENHNC